MEDLCKRCNKPKSECVCENCCCSDGEPCGDDCQCECKEE